MAGFWTSLRYGAMGLTIAQAVETLVSMYSTGEANYPTALELDATIEPAVAAVRGAVPKVKLSDDLVLYLCQANVAAVALYVTGKPISTADLPDIEVVAAAVHLSWMKGKMAQGIKSRLAEDGEELMVPYSMLSAKQKAMDRSLVQTVYDAMKSV